MDGHFMLAAVRPAQQHLQAAVVGKELVVQHINDFIAVYRNDRVAHMGLPVQGAAAIDGFDDIFHTLHK